MKKFVALKLKTGVGYMVTETRFDREIGDTMDIDNVKWTVICFSKNESNCFAACNAEIAIINEETKTRNTARRVAASKQPLSDFDKTVISIINKYL